uniref:Multiple epidermal growth factor-like domains protein 6 n=1 Tax=Denticeps clupeoides TaxID=299321 RepID=A0AAY4CR03_9TELE
KALPPCYPCFSQPCVQAFTRMVKVWKQDCSGSRWCEGYERRTGYFTAYRQVYSMDVHTVYRCCPGWSQRDGETGCLHSKFVFRSHHESERSDFGEQLCECPAGFQGPRCQYGESHTVERLTVVSCAVKNGGCEHRCVDLGNDQFKCECHHDYQLGSDGKQCKLKDPCIQANGGCEQLCSNINGQVECSCRVGYTLNSDHRRCEDIDECSSGRGHCSHGCVNIPGSFRCVCNPGFELGADGRQCYRIEMEIVDSCEKHNGGCSHHCDHSTNGPVCSCNHGYQLSEDRKTCIDSDECESGEACCSHYCENYPGGYECNCRAGLILNADGCGCDGETEKLGEEEDDDELEVLHLPELLFRRQPQFLHYTAGRHGPFLHREECVFLYVLYVFCLSVCVLVCVDGAFGQDCSLSCEDCNNGGVCSENRDGCDCAPGWTGVVCNDGVILHLTHFSMVIGCPQGYYGMNCRRKCHCPNNGHCHQLYGGCLCAPGLYGRFCHLPCPKWAFGLGCSGECVCDRPNSLGCNPKTGICTCKPGYHGNHCQTGTFTFTTFTRRPYPERLTISSYRDSTTLEQLRVKCLAQGHNGSKWDLNLGLLVHR